MSNIYNEEYYRQYDVGVGKVNYLDSQYTKGFLESVAERIVADLHPKTVLDAGCATGHLVAALRDRGVEAYGVDLSEYAISAVREDVRPYCAVGSLAEPLPEKLPGKYDLVVSIEVLEHLPTEDGQKAIKNLCTYADTVLFSSTPDDFEDPTHINVQQREYWTGIFAKESFLDDLSYRPFYLTNYAICFRRKDNILDQIADYERNIRVSEDQHRSDVQALENARKAQDQQISLLSLQIEEQSEKIAKLSAWNDSLVAEKEKLVRELTHYRECCQVAMDQREDLSRQLASVQGKYDAVTNAMWWKLTKPGRAIFGGIKKLLKSNRFTYLLAKGVKCLFREGIRSTWRKARRKLTNRVDYRKARKPIYTAEDLAQQRKKKFSRDIKFSILVPLYNTPEKYLHEMIRSVQNQTYANWELCLADGSDQQHRDVEKICAQYCKKDSRIIYKKLEKNMGISGNTNACIEMSTGEYIALFDHDDLLHPAALYEMMTAVCEQDADMIYTDENTFHHTPEDAFFPHYKPDYAPDTLRSYNYICHFTAFSRELLEKAGGGFRSEFDGSQDYDLILRLTEQAKNVVHIPKILYYWRSHANSVASDISAKPYTMIAAKKALTEHLERVGLKGEVLDSTIPSTYRIRYEIEGEPLISILIPNKDHIDDLKKCIDSIVSVSTYQNWEIIIIENNSTENRTFAYYDEIQKDQRIHVVTWAGEFNYSAINNFGAQSAQGDYLLLLNNDVEVLTPDWLEQMLMFAQRKDVGAVGAMLYYPDDTVQHAGVILGIGGVAGHAHKCFPRKSYGYVSRMTIAQNYSCVTAACVLIRREIWTAINGLDESFKVAFNDVDMCMRIRKAGYLVVWTPYAELYHYESKSRGLEDTIEKQRRFQGEVERFMDRWHKELAAGDPYYNPNLSLEREDFSLKDD
ncbi:MAG: glycosyltransferase [Ruminococcaceae bacterium]|nr:glycosyltransferase [Oscillospiraceae bacterium]